VTLVGKGVCFDSGGLDLKTSAGMLTMKKDMGGAAVVLGLAQMVMDAKLPLRLRVLIPAVENAVSGRAYRPGDVLRSRKGLTVEIGNTDAEGHRRRGARGRSRARCHGCTRSPVAAAALARLRKNAREPDCRSEQQSRLPSRGRDYGGAVPQPLRGQSALLGASRHSGLDGPAASGTPARRGSERRACAVRSAFVTLPGDDSASEKKGLTRSTQRARKGRRRNNWRAFRAPKGIGT
jgi:hypothetical protein